MLHEIFEEIYKNEREEYKEAAEIIIKFAFQNPTIKELFELIDNKIEEMTKND